MCGIVGIIAPDLSQDQIQPYLYNMNNAIIHRGPDDEGAFIDNGIGLAMRRLAILDLSPTGKQPMKLASADLVMIYNGELYNYKELRLELEAKGHTLVGHSDTEVLLHAYHEWGMDAFTRFNGMFALAIWNKQTRQLLLARDRVGEKPLFYWCNGQRLIFASEMKALLRCPWIDKTIDPEALYHYLVYNSVPRPNTILSTIKQVNPASIMVVNSNLEFSEYDYWSMPLRHPDYSMREETVIDQVHELLIDAVQIRLRSDVPVGVFLSGGVDSSLLSAIATQLHPGIQTFSVGYEDQRMDESRFAVKVARHLQTEHHTVTVQPTALELSEIIETADDPLGSSTIYPYLKLAALARQHVTVALSGDGGDEFFCGYIAFAQIGKILEARQRVPDLIWNLGAKLGRILANHPKVNPGLRTLEFNTPGQFVAQYISRFPLQEIAALVAPPPAPSVPRSYILTNGEYDFPTLNHRTATTYLHDTVLKTSDRSTMRHSLEGRLPLTDHRLIELAARIPPEILLKDGIDKYVLKRILWRYVPRALVERPKTGFGLPSRDWVFGVWRPLLDHYLTSERLSMSGALNVQKTLQLVEQGKRRQRGYDRLIWNLLIFQMWWEHIVLGEAYPRLSI